MKIRKRNIIMCIILIIIIVTAIFSFIYIEREKLRQQIEKDELEYGNQYKKLSEAMPKYTKEPDRILYKPKEKDYFYEFKKEDKDYQHVLEVAEDRMVYSLWKNSGDFAQDSLDRILSSGKNYIIFDYDNLSNINQEENADKDLTNSTIIYKLKDENRCKRLLTYLTQFRQKIDWTEISLPFGTGSFGNLSKILQKDY